MSKDEIQKMSDEDLITEWQQISLAYKSSLPQHLSNHQSLVLFSMFVNVSEEMSKRNLNPELLNQK